MEIPIKMDDLGVPLFSETPNIYQSQSVLNRNSQQDIQAALHTSNKRLLAPDASAQARSTSVSSSAEEVAEEGFLESMVVPVTLGRNPAPVDMIVYPSIYNVLQKMQ